MGYTETKRQAVVSPDNRSRVQINERIHAKLQEGGLVSRDEHRIQALVPRQDLTGPERTWAGYCRTNFPNLPNTP